ncbi:hypothetical protein BGW42_004229 [Actinomortierella wolfii]|nr:hypothetical protein BGW42_004229 [Actinomortierella wolfii]
MSRRTHAILLLKEDPKSVASKDSEDVMDVYREALMPLLCRGAVEETREGLPTEPSRLDYLAPLVPVYPADTPLHSAVRQRPDVNHIWALAFTSQNGVKAFEMSIDAAWKSSSADHKCPQQEPQQQQQQKEQEQKEILDAWLALPVFCLSGSTLKAVERTGFRSIYGRDFVTLDHEGRPVATPSPSPSLPLSLGNASQLADVLLSVPWPSSLPNSPSLSSSSPSFTSPPALWFLTGETRMSTLRGRFQEHPQGHLRPLREIEVYRTDPQPEIEDKLATWLQEQIKGCSTHTAAASSSSFSQQTASPCVIWLVGFSPKGVDLVWPGVERALTLAAASPDWTGHLAADDHGSPSSSSDDHPRVLIQWAAIGQTTATLIRDRISQMQLLKQGHHDSPGNVSLSSSVAVAAHPKPEHLAKAMREHSSILGPENTSNEENITI